MRTWIGAAVMAVAATGAWGAVEVKEDNATYTIDSGVIKAVIQKRSGDVTKLDFRGVDVLGNNEGGKAGAYWSLPASGMGFGTLKGAELRDDPAKNGGRRATVVLHFPYDGNRGTMPADVELVYSMAADDSALYAMGNFDHRPDY